MIHYVKTVLYRENCFRRAPAAAPQRHQRVNCARRNNIGIEQSVCFVFPAARLQRVQLADFTRPILSKWLNT